MTSAMKSNREVNSASNGVRTFVLVGPVGTGKSATGNSIIGKRVFNSSQSSTAVTTTCELQQAVLNDGLIINVIDTPGVNRSGFARNEFVKCMSMAEDGIHAFLLVLSPVAPFTEEHANVIPILQNVYGSKIVDYMIVVFTGRDQLPQTLDAYLGGNCPQPLKEIVTLGKNRKLIFDNETERNYTKAEQLQQLLSFVDLVTKHNGGQPYTNEISAALQIERLKVRTSGLEQQLAEERVANNNQETEIDAKLKSTRNELEQQLAEEKQRREKSEQEISAKISVIEKDVEEVKEQIKKKNNQSKCCVIM